jgi:hypothetical protein
MIEAADADHERVRSACIFPRPRSRDPRLSFQPVANVAARDLYGLTDPLPHLPNAEPRRYLVVEEPLVEPAYRVFASQRMSAPPYCVGTLAADELTGIFAERYHDRNFRRVSKLRRDCSDLRDRAR